MPKMVQETSPTLDLVTELTPTQRAQLMRELKVYEALKDELAEAERDLAVSKSIVEGLREELGIASITPEPGYHITLVDGQTSQSLDKPALMKAFKITPKQWAGFVRSKPKKAYTLITLPKDAPVESAKPQAKRSTRRDERDIDDRE